MGVYLFLKMKRMTYIGGFGHWPQVAAELSGWHGVEAVGVAPAYEGEDLSAMQVHPALPEGLPVFSSAAEMLSEIRPDVAVVSTRPDYIAQTAVLAADHGCDVICEKPLGVTLEQAVLVYEAVRRNGVRLLPMLSMRTDPVFVKARELYASGAIGEAASIFTQKSYPFGERASWFGDRSKYGGTFPWVGIHSVDMIHFITGLRFRSVTARHANFSHSERPDCEDNCAAIFELSNGALASMTADLLRPTAAPTYGDDRIRIAGTKGVLEAVSNDGVVRVIDGKGERVVSADSGAVSFYGEFLADQVGGLPLVAEEDGFVLTEAMLSARDSADQNGVFVNIESRWGM